MYRYTKFGMASSLARREEPFMRSSPSSDSGMAFPVPDPPIQVLNRHMGKQSQCTWKMAAHEPGRGKHHRSGAWLQDASPPYRGLSKGAAIFQVHWLCFP